MQSERLTINNHDLSSTIEDEVVQSVTGFTIIESSSGPYEPILIDKVSTLEKIFGEPEVNSDKFCDLYEVEKFISGGFPCYVGNNLAKGSNTFPCILVTNDGYYYATSYSRDTTSTIVDNGSTYYKYEAWKDKAILSIDDKFVYLINNIYTVSTSIPATSNLSEDQQKTSCILRKQSSKPSDKDIIAYIYPKYPSTSFVTVFDIESAADSKLDDPDDLNYRDILSISEVEYPSSSSAKYVTKAYGIVGTLGDEVGNGVSLYQFDDSNGDYSEQIGFEVYYTGNKFSSTFTPIEKAHIVCFSGSELAGNTEDKDWSILEDTLYDNVDIAFDVAYHTNKVTAESHNATFFELGADNKTRQLCRFIFNQTYEGTKIPSSTSIDTLDFGSRYWNICGYSKIKVTDLGYINTTFVGAFAEKIAEIIRDKNGGEAPIYTTGILNTNISSMPYRYNASDLTYLSKANYNPVVYDSNYGVMLTSHKTCKKGAITDWSYIGHVSAFLDFQKEVYNTIMIPQLGKPNNPYYRDLRQQQIDQLLNERLVTNRIWAEGVADTSTADGVNDETARKARKFIIKCKVKVDIFSEYVVLDFTNVDQSTTLS